MVKSKGWATQPAWVLLALIGAVGPARAQQAAVGPSLRSQIDKIVTPYVSASDFMGVVGVQRDGEPYANSLSRLLKGVELLADGRSSRLVVSEIRPPAGRLEPMARDWVARLAPGGEVLSVGQISNTHDEAVPLQLPAE